MMEVRNKVVVGLVQLVGKVEVDNCNIENNCVLRVSARSLEGCQDSLAQ